jgi:hypothetical protein
VSELAIDASYAPGFIARAIANIKMNITKNTTAAKVSDLPVSIVRTLNTRTYNHVVVDTATKNAMNIFDPMVTTSLK